jgi:hypothetical protein
MTRAADRDERARETSWLLYICLEGAKRYRIKSERRGRGEKLSTARSRAPGALYESTTIHARVGRHGESDICARCRPERHRPAVS